jgi:hypothetical protein
MNDAGGEGFIPFGNPLTVTVTGPVKPFCGLSETVMGEVVAPTCVETEEEETAILKSAMGGGGGAEELPHPSRKHKLQSAIKSNRDFLKAPLQNCRLYARARFTCFLGAY